MSESENRIIMNTTKFSLDDLAKFYGKPLELCISSNQKQFDYENFVVKSEEFYGHGDECPEQAIKNFEYKVLIIRAIEKDIEHVSQSKRTTVDFLNKGLNYLVNLYECYYDRSGNFHVDYDRNINPIEFFDEALDELHDIKQTVKKAKSIDDTSAFLSYIMGEHDIERGISCTIWDGYSDKLFPNLTRLVSDLQNDSNDFDTII